MVFLALAGGAAYDAPAYAEPVDFLELFSRAETFHESVAASRERAQQAAMEKRKALGALLPTLSADYDLQQRDGSIEKIISGSPVTIRSERTTDLSITATQTVFTGGRATNELRRATLGEVAGQLGVRMAREELIADVAEAFFNVLKARENLSTVSERLDGMQHHLEAARARVRLGADVRASELRLESEVAQLSAEKAANENDLANAREALADLTGEDPNIELGNPPKLDGIVDMTDPLAKALADRVDLQILKGETLAAKYSVRASAGPFWPLLSVEATHEQQTQKPASQFTPDEDNYVMFRASWNLFNGGEDVAERKRIRAAFREKRLELDQTKREISLQVEQAVRQVGVARRIVDALTDGLTYATENHRIVTETYKAGAATYLDVIDASNTLGDARRDLANARNDFSLALLNLARVTGQLLTVVGEAVPRDERLERVVDRELN